MVVAGYVSKAEPGCARTSSDRQFLFLNRRPVDIPKVTRTVNEAYRHVMPKATPAFVLDLTLAPDAYDINVIVENHGGLSSDGAWLAGVMRRCDHPRVGTLPDFGNFYEYDRYQGVADLMPFAKAVSAKSYAFDGEGNETKIDYARMMRIVKDAGYRGWVGVEYEGGDADERAGITRTRELLERLRKELG